MEALLPGDFLPLNSKTNDSFVIKDGENKATTVLGYLKDDVFHELRSATVPKVHDIVIGRVIRSKRKEVHLVLLMVNNTKLNSPLLAELRSVDIQEKDVDSVIASKIFKPGDLVKARVVALGRSGFYSQLSTAEEGLGIVTLEEK